MAEGRGESQGKGKRKVEYDGCLWPVKKAPSSSNVVYAKSLDDWNSVEEIQIGERRFPFFSNKGRSDVLLSHSTFRIWYGSNVDNLIVPIYERGCEPLCQVSVITGVCWAAPESPI